MAYGITITGLKEAQRLLGTNFKPALQAATKAIALQVQGEIAPYPPATGGNSPSNPTGRWYERGYGPRWRRKDGSVGGRKTSQMLGRQWGIRASGAWGQIVGNRATYAPYVHAEGQQARVHRAHRWVTDRQAAISTVQSGAVKRIVTQAIVGAMRRR